MTNTLENTIKCEICGLVCKMQIPASHLRSAHNMTTQEYKDLGYTTLSPARLAQLQKSSLAKGEFNRPSGKNHPRYKGGHISKTSGYKIVYIDGAQFYEHRLVAEKMLGRPLKKGETVHHIDRNRANNSPSNLVVMTNQEHSRIPKENSRTYNQIQAANPVERAIVDLCHAEWTPEKISKALGWPLNKVRKVISQYYVKL